MLRPCGFTIDDCVSVFIGVTAVKPLEMWPLSSSFPQGKEIIFLSGHAIPNSTGDCCSLMLTFGSQVGLWEPNWTIYLPNTGLTLKYYLSHSLHNKTTPLSFLCFMFLCADIRKNVHRLIKEASATAQVKGNNSFISVQEIGGLCQGLMSNYQIMSLTFYAVLQKADML